MAKSVTEAGFDRLSTHGILSSLVQDDIVHLLDVLTSCELVARNEYGCVSITQLGGEVMRGDVPMPEALERQLDIALVEPSRRQRRKQTRRSDAASATGSTYDRTLELINEGLDYEQIAEARGLKVTTITNHFIKLAARGDTFDLSDDLDGDILARMRTLAEDWHEGDQLRPLKDALPDSCSYAKLKIHLAQVLMER